MGDPAALAPGTLVVGARCPLTPMTLKQSSFRAEPLQGAAPTQALSSPAPQKSGRRKWYTKPSREIVALPP